MNVNLIQLIALVVVSAGGLLAIYPAFAPLPSQFVQADRILEAPNQLITIQRNQYLASGIPSNFTGFSQIVDLIYSHTLTTTGLPPSTSVKAIVMLKENATIVNNFGIEPDGETFYISNASLPRLSLIQVGNGNDWRTWIASERGQQQTSYTTVGGIVAVAGGIFQFVASTMLNTRKRTTDSNTR